jgi:NTE family protein
MRLDPALKQPRYNQVVSIFRLVLRVPIFRLVLMLVFSSLLFSSFAAAQSDPAPQPVAEPAAQSSLGRPKVAILLAGGVARSFAYLGVLEELTEAGVPIDLIVGTSAGAMVSGLYSSGYSFETLNKIFSRMARHQNELVSVNFPFTQSLLEIGGFERVYRALVNDGRIETTSPPLAIMATELRPGTTAPILKGNLADTVRASISLPLVFPVATLEGRNYVDGGLRNPFPVDVARSLGADFVISVRGKSEGKTKPEDLIDVISFLVWTLTGSSTPIQFDASVPVKTFDTQYFDFSQASELIARGRQEARAAMPKLLAALAAKNIPVNPSGDPHANNPVNLEWESRLESGLNAAYERDRDLKIFPALEAGSADAWGSRTGRPSDATLSIGASVTGGPLGRFSVGAGYVEQFDQPGGSGYVRFGYGILRGLEASAEFDPSRRPTGAPWAFGLTYDARDFVGYGWTGGLEVDALGTELNATWTPETGDRGPSDTGDRGPSSAGEFRPSFSTNLRLGYAPSARLEASAALEWQARVPWFVRTRGAFGLSTGGAEGFALGAPNRLRAFAPEFLIAPQYAALNLEFGYRWDFPNLGSVIATQPEIRLFADLGTGFDFAHNTSRTLWDVGLGASAPVRFFGLLPAHFGVDLAFSNESWRTNLYTRVPLP